MAEVRPEKGKAEAHQTSPPSTADPLSLTIARRPEGHLLRAGSARGAGEVAMVRRSSVAPWVTCGLCGDILRDATTVSECLHSFCRQCILQKIEDEDIECRPTCSTDLGSDPLEKLRTDHSLLNLRLMTFPAKRHKVKEMSLLHPALVSLPSHSFRAHGGDHSTKKADAHLMVEPMKSETETEADVTLGIESTASPTKPSGSIPCTAVAAGTGTATPAASSYSGDAQKECTQLTKRESVGELQGTMQWHGNELRIPTSELAIQFEEFKCEDHELVTNQAMPQERSTPAENVAFLMVGVEKERGARASVESTLSSAVEIAAEGRSALSPVASHIKRHENTARTFEMVEFYMGRCQGLELENARLSEELDNERAEKPATFERTRILEGKLQAEYERLQRESEIAEKTEATQGQLFPDCRALESEIAAWKLLFWDYQALKSEISERTEDHATLQNDTDMLEKDKTCLEYQVDRLTESLAQRTASIFERLDAYIGWSEASEAENIRLRADLDIERAKTAAALERTRTLEERLQRESEIAQRTEAALRQLLRDYNALESEISDESEERATLQHNM